MYKSYNLTLYGWDLEDFSGDTDYNLEKKEAGSLLKQLINSDHDIAAEDIKSIFFPQNSYDVFISHSRSDLDLALRLRQYLKDHFDLRVFVDSICWENIDDLQKELDEHYRTNDNNYKYETVKRVAQHSNIILASALTEAIDKSECVFFLNTKNSVVSGARVKEDKTYSPWIYHEVYTASTIRQRKPNRKPANESRNNALYEAVNPALPTITYGLDLSNMAKLDSNSLLKWEIFYKTTYRSHALDVLYKHCNNIEV